MSPRRILVVGTGSIGLRHARLCKERPDLAVEVCDSRPAGLDEARKVLGLSSTWPPPLEPTPADAPADGHTVAERAEEIVESVKDGMSGGQPPTVV